MNVGAILEAEKHTNLISLFIDILISNTKMLTYLSVVHLKVSMRKYKIAKFNGNTNKYLNFRIRLPNDTTRTLIRISLQLLTQLSEDKISTTATMSPRITTLQTNNNNRPGRYGAYKLFTINDVVDALKKDLIEKETNIGGIIESALAFHRHFN
ncbi:hypothetical protein GQX74_010199 [Glossina fuscipes]|nr:hypothetical protein GQX74_010199 [Glossina fuscipes]